MERSGTLEQLLVEITAVGGAKVLDDQYVALLVDAGVAGGGERVLEPDLGVIAAAEHDVAVEVVDHSRVVAGSTVDHEPGRAMRHVRAAERRGRVHAGGVGWERPTGGAPLDRVRLTGAQVPAGAAGDPQQEQVQHDQEAELEGHRYGRERGHPSSKTISVEPSSTRSPARSACTPRTSRSLTITPLVEPRSSIVQPSALGRIWAWRRETPTSSMTMSQSRLRPIVPPAAGTSSRRPPVASSARGAPRRACACSTEPPRRAEVL